MMPQPERGAPVGLDRWTGAMNTRIRILAAAGVGTLVLGVLSAGPASADPHISWTSVPATTDVRGMAAPNALSPQLREIAVAQGSHKLENGTSLAAYYGYNGNGTLMPDPALVQSPGHPVEASKTEPDKNTYLRLSGLHGADPNYSYGTHFLFQGHETGLSGYLTRINLDADDAHRVTLLATQQANGAAIPVIDGSTWDPWAQRLLFTAELGSNGAVLQSTPDINAVVQDMSFVFGRGGFEGIQNDSAGNLQYVEDVGGASPAGSKAKNPNSFVYRLVPYNKADLSQGGVVQALQVVSLRSHQPITFQAIDAAHPTGGIFTDDQKDLSSYGNVFDTNWVTIHDTHVDTSGNPFDANAAAKAAGATPFKRPENGQFRPGTGFREFYFASTGDTNATSPANTGFGGWGAVFKLAQEPTANQGHLQVVYLADLAHTGFDNVTFIDRDHVAFVEDASDTVHTQRGAFDSAYLFDLRVDYSHGAQPVRFLAEGRDASATLDNMLSALGNGFQNEGDNEITGIHMSDGDPTVEGILGAKIPHPFRDGWRLFWTQQHGDNITWEILDASRHGEDD
jgi:hypothetical protein